jgi:FtsZ-interacting cell division protein ZipA
MSTWVWVVLAIVVVAIVAAAVWAGMRKRRSTHLQQHFGDEYERTVDESGSRRRAESELAAREQRRSKLEIVPLRTAARDRYAESWRGVQANFVDDPRGAVREADGLVGQVMQERGYPMDDFEQQAADVSVDHPEVVSNYRSAHDISQRNDDGEATTEELRQAMVHYRALFEELLVVESPERVS